LKFGVLVGRREQETAEQTQLRNVSHTQTHTAWRRMTA